MVGPTETSPSWHMCHAICHDEPHPPCATCPRHRPAHAHVTARVYFETICKTPATTTGSRLLRLARSRPPLKLTLVFHMHFVLTLAHREEQPGRLSILKLPQDEDT